MDRGENIKTLQRRFYYVLGSFKNHQILNGKNVFRQTKFRCYLFWGHETIILNRLKSKYLNLNSCSSIFVIFQIVYNFSYRVCFEFEQKQFFCLQRNFEQRIRIRGSHRHWQGFRDADWWNLT